MGDIFDLSLLQLLLLWVILTTCWGPALNIGLGLSGIKVATVHQLWIAPILALLGLVPYAGTVLIGGLLVRRVAEEDSTSFFYAALFITSMLTKFVAFTLYRYATGT